MARACQRHGGAREAQLGVVSWVSLGRSPPPCRTRARSPSSPPPPRTACCRTAFARDPTACSGRLRPCCRSCSFPRRTRRDSRGRLLRPGAALRQRAVPHRGTRAPHLARHVPGDRPAGRIARLAGAGAPQPARRGGGLGRGHEGARRAARDAGRPVAAAGRGRADRRDRALPARGRPGRGSRGWHLGERGLAATKKIQFQLRFCVSQPPSNGPEDGRDAEHGTEQALYLPRSPRREQVTDDRERDGEMAPAPTPWIPRKSHQALHAPAERPDRNEPMEEDRDTDEQHRPADHRYRTACRRTTPVMVAVSR